MRKALTIILSVLLVVSMFVSCNQDDIIDDLFEPTYSIKVAGTIGHGTVSADKTNAHEGDTVTLTATPAEGYELSAFSVTDDKANAITVTDGSFTMPADNVTVGATFSKTAETINQEAAAAVTTKIGAIGTVSYTAESKAKIDEARSAYDALNAAQKALIPAETLAILTTAESSYSTQKAAAEAEAAANQAAADAVTTKINAIGEVTYTAESKTKIDDARSAYDALTDAQKALIPAETLTILTTAESSYSTQKAAIDTVVAKIGAIGTVTYTAESKTKIDEARTSYDALTDSQKALVPAETLAVLTKAETDYNALKTSADEAAANQAAADAVIAKINAIGMVAYTTESKTKIDEARTAYDALTEAQKALVSAETLSVLTAAETKYAELKAAAEQQTAGSISYVTTTVSKTTDDAAFTNELTKTGDGTVSYSSSDANVATVNATTGEVTIVGAGTATITATVTDSASYTYATKTASYTVKVLSETLLTTITATGQEQASYSTENVATVSFSYTANGSSSYYNKGTTNWGWWGYGWIATVTPVDGYTITKCVFYDDKDRTATDSEAPFVVETTEEDKTPQVNGTPILAYQSKGITKIEVYGYVNP